MSQRFIHQSIFGVTRLVDYYSFYEGSCKFYYQLYLIHFLTFNNIISQIKMNVQLTIHIVKIVSRTNITNIFCFEQW